MILVWLALVRTLRFLFFGRVSRRSILLEFWGLHHQLLLYQRSATRPVLRDTDRIFWICLSSLYSRWKQILRVVRPQTVLHWHKRRFKRFWSRISRGGRPRTAKQIRYLVRQMAAENPTWGVPRIRGELLKLGIRLAHSTIRKIIAPVRKSPPGGQKWTTFLTNHVQQIWATDFFTVRTLGFKQLYVMVILAVHTRKILHCSLTDHPDSRWVYRQVLQTTWDNPAPRFLICDRDSKFSQSFREDLKHCLKIEVLRTPVRSPKSNSFVERLIGSIRRECLDHFLIFGERSLRGILREYVHYYNHFRPHQGIHQKIPNQSQTDSDVARNGPVRSLPILGGLHHHYYRKAA